MYTLAIRLFQAIAPLFQWTNPKFGKWVRSRHQWKVDLADYEKQDKLAWFHCASVGEFEQARPVIEALKEQDTTWQIAITFFSSSGYEVRKDYPLADVVTYLPTDLPEVMSRFIDTLKPDLAVFVKYEFWFNAMEQIKRRGIPMILISAHLTDKHWTTQWLGIHLGQRLAQFDRIFAQDEDTVNRLNSVYIMNAEAVGDTRVDRVLANAAEPFHSDFLERFSNENQVMVVGSNWPADDEVIMKVFEARKGLKLIVAPHELKEEQQKRWRNVFGDEMVLWSEAGTADLTSSRVLYLNTIGLLSKVYRFADVAYVGGGFGKAVHNTLEAVVYRIPVIFGPNNKRFQEIQQLKSIGAGIEVASSDDFGKALDRALSDNGYREEVVTSLDRFFNQQKGATESILTWIKGQVN